MLLTYCGQCCCQQQYFVRYTREAVSVSNSLVCFEGRVVGTVDWCFLASVVDHPRYLKPPRTPCKPSWACFFSWMTTLLMYLFCFSLVRRFYLVSNMIWMDLSPRPPFMRQRRNCDESYLSYKILFEFCQFLSILCQFFGFLLGSSWEGQMLEQGQLLRKRCERYVCCSPKVYSPVSFLLLRVLLFHTIFVYLSRVPETSVLSEIFVRFTFWYRLKGDSVHIVIVLASWSSPSQLLDMHI